VATNALSRGVPLPHFLSSAEKDIAAGEVLQKLSALKFKNAYAIFLGSEKCVAKIMWQLKTVVPIRCTYLKRCIGLAS